MKAKFVVLITCIASLLCFLFLTYPFKLGLTADSISYIFVAESIAKGDGVVNENGILINHWPPFYSIILAIISKVTQLNIPFSALYFNAFLIFTLPYIYYKIVKTVNLKITYQILFPVIIVVSFAALRHRYLLTEALFLTLLLLALFFFLKWIKHDKTKYLVLSGVLSGLLILTRYAGVGFVFGFCIYLFFIQPETLKYKFKTLCIYLLCSLFLLLIWLFYSSNIDGPKNIREFQSHIISWSQLVSIFKVIGSWLISNKISAIAFILLFAVSAFTSKINVLFQLIKSNILNNRKYISIIAILFLSYIIFIIIALSFFDSRIPISNRIFSCLYPLLLILIALIFNFSMQEKRLNKLVLIGFLIIFFSSVYVSKPTWENHFNNGAGYTSKAWKNSEIIKFIKNSKTLNVYSNGHDIVRFYKHIDNEYLPFPELETYQQDLELMTNEVKKGNKNILFFSNINRAYFIPKDSLLNEFKNFNIRYFNDGFIISKPN